MSTQKPTKALPPMAEADIAIARIAPETSFKNKAYGALREAILKMDIYATPEPVMLDERVDSVHLCDDHASAQLIERLAWAVTDAEAAQDQHAHSAA